MQSNGYDSIRPLRWRSDGLELLDQRRLPQHRETLVVRSAAQTAAAIKEMVVRGAPAIGIAAAYGVVLSARARYASSREQWREGVARDMRELGAARPTAFNLGWAIARMSEHLAGIAGDPAAPLLGAANAMLEADIAANKRMGALGARFIARGSGVLTHCNAGALATGGYGTALGVVRSAWAAGAIDHVYAGETRPWLQGARLTAWELLEEHIPVSLITDGAAAYAMQTAKVQWVIVGADRIAANGDVANKIGTYSLALAARHHGIGFMVVAPTSSVDPDTACGAEIPIEMRSADELLRLAGECLAAPGACAWNPVFDVTPAALIDVLVTECGVVEKPDGPGIAKLMAGAARAAAP